jgi:hypothetical protein
VENHLYGNLCPYLGLQVLLLLLLLVVSHAALGLEEVNRL